MARPRSNKKRHNRDTPQPFLVRRRLLGAPHITLGKTATDQRP